MSTLWEGMLKQIVKEYQSFPASFLRQPTISKTTHPNVQDLAVLYYNDLMQGLFFKERILPGLKDGLVGQPFQFKLLPECSPLTIQHAYHLNLVHEHLGVFIPSSKISRVVEIGGGYGNLCRLIKQFGYAGTYTIVDFPEMLQLQQHYLKQHAVSQVEFVTLEESSLFLPSSEVSILIATFSVNEMPMESRKILEDQYNQYDYLFFAYNTAFDGINNIEYFNQLRSNLDPLFETQCIKDKYKNSWFMLCKKRVK